MSFKGTVKNGRVILPRNARLADGTEVVVTPVPVRPADGLADMLVRISKKVRGLPRDLAAQHDHYLYGTPKK